MRVRSLLAAVVLGAAIAVTGVGTGVGETTSAQAAQCQHRTGVRHVDWTARVFTQDWVCPNKPGATLYQTPDHGYINGWMHSSRSWFVCWTIGIQHGGGNKVWYWTQGDEVASDRQYSLGWGWMPAYDNYTSTDPVPGMPAC